MPSIHFFSEDLPFKITDPIKKKRWLKGVLLSERKSLGTLNYVFCSDTYLHAMNIEYLKHDTLTDIITFDSSEEDNEISGDIFISIERARENAKNLGLPFEAELSRLLVHGLLHLVGFPDKSEAEKRIMRAKEDSYLSLLR